MLPTTSDLAQASAAVRDAKRALIDAERRFDSDCGLDNTLARIAEIQAAERRVVEATAALRSAARSRL